MAAACYNKSWIVNKIREAEDGMERGLDTWGCPHPNHQQALWPQAVHLYILKLSFLICKKTVVCSPRISQLQFTSYHLVIVEIKDQAVCTVLIIQQHRLMHSRFWPGFAMIRCSKIKCQGAAAKREEAGAATLRGFALHLVFLIKDVMLSCWKC